MVRIVLAICGGLNPRGHVIAEMRDIDNCELVTLVGKSNGTPARRVTACTLLRRKEIETDG